MYTVQSVELASTILLAKNKLLYAKLELSVAAIVTSKELSRATRRVKKNTTYLAKVIAAENTKEI